MVAESGAALQAYGPHEVHMNYVGKLGTLIDKAFIADFESDQVAEQGLVHIVNFNGGDYE